MTKLIFPLFVLAFLLSAPQVFAQEKTATAQQDSLLRVEMKDGTVFIGKRLAMTDTDLILETESMGKLSLPLANIREMRGIRTSPASGGEYWPENPAAHQNLIGPNAFGLRKGQKQYNNFMLGFNQMGFGISDNFSLFAGVEVFTLLAGISEGELFGPGFVVRPHLSFPINPDKFTIGGGLIVTGIVGTGEGLFAVAPYANLTIGNRDRNVNATVGLPIASGGVAAPFFTLNGNLRLTKGFGLLMENWVLPDGFALLNTTGVRLFGERTAWTISLAFGAADGEFEILPIPVGGFTISF